MKFTTMFGALALTAALSATAFGGTVKSDNFEGWDISDATEVDPYGYPQKPVNTITGFETKDAAGNGWTVNGGEEDQSAIVATHFEGGGKALRLNTNGSTLEFAAATQNKFEATVSMKVQMVASDTEVNMDTDTETHTALYLHKDGDDENANTVLRAFGYDAVAERNKWYDLAVSGVVASNVVADGATADVVIKMDYDSGYATYTINNVEYDAIQMANKNAAQGRSSLHSVAFKGTGYVDDLFVSEQQSGTYAEFLYEVAGLTGDDAADNGIEPIGTLDGTNKLETLSIQQAISEYTGYDMAVTLVSRTAGAEDQLLATLTPDGEGNVTITPQTAQFAENGSYVLKATYTLKDSVVTIMDEDDNVIDTVTQKWFTEFTFTPAEGATFTGWELDGEEQLDSPDEVVIDSLEADTYTIVLYDYSAPSGGKVFTSADIVAGSLTWTAYDPAAGTAAFTLTVSTAPVEGDTFGGFAAITAATLDGATANVGTGAITAVNGTAVTGTVTGLPTNGNGLFLFGLADVEAAPAAGE